LEPIKSIVLLMEPIKSFVSLMGSRKLVWLFVWWCLTPLSTIFQSYSGGKFYWRRTRRKPHTSHKSLKNFITPPWPWSYGSWIYNYICSQCLSPLTLLVRISNRARWTTLCDKVFQWLPTCFFFNQKVSVRAMDICAILPEMWQDIYATKV
jgi:hypothetical protein